ncbi:MAG TPA: hypothetical protein VH083_26570 [Myxococcales bacterium]|nr:hypothetical protein [Myxococcales bacterium]
MRVFCVAFLCSTAALAGQVGLYPFQLPHGETRQAARLASQLYEPKDGSPLLAVEPSGCAPDEEVCLAGVAQRAGLSSITSAQVDEIASGYRVHVRAVSADAKLIGEWQGEVRADDLGPALQRGICESLGATYSEPVITSVPRAALPGGLSVGDARARVELGLFAGGLGLLTAAAGVGLYAKISQQGQAPRNGLSEQSSASHSANIFALALAATGLGAIGAGGLMIALTPESATLQARF